MYKNIFEKLLTSAVTLLLIFSIIACSSNNEPTKQQLILSNTDYSDANNWLSFGGCNSKDVDIFVVYPIVINSNDETDRPNACLNSPIMRTSAAVWLETIDEIISQNANVFAPFYRQINAVEIIEPNWNNEIFSLYANSIPREDIFAAFDYYLKNVNKGKRPFILFGFSHGAYLVTELATTLLGHENYKQHNENHIITYAIGMSVVNYQIAKNPNLKFSQNKNDIGVIVSWNSTAPSEVETEEYKNFITYRQNALVTNPISWTTDETPAPASENGASRVTVNGTAEMIYNYADATVDKKRGILLVTSVDEANYKPMLPVVISKFHGGDINWFNESIMQNIKNRIEEFKEKNK